MGAGVGGRTRRGRKYLKWGGKKAREHVCASQRRLLFRGSSLIRPTLALITIHLLYHQPFIAAITSQNTPAASTVSLQAQKKNKRGGQRSCTSRFVKESDDVSDALLPPPLRLRLQRPSFNQIPMKSEAAVAAAALISLASAGLAPTSTCLLFI